MKLFKNLVAAVFASSLLVFLIYSINKPDKQRIKERDASWGEGRKIKMEVGMEYLVNSQYLMYLGMNDSERFSISHTGRAACPVSYPASVKEFRLYEHRLKLEKVTPEYIEFTYLERIR